MNDAITDRDPVLGEILRRLVEAYQPERVYLFGSKARGDEGPDSDCDLMVVVPDSAPPERRRSRLAYQVIWGSGTTAREVALCPTTGRGGAAMDHGESTGRRTCNRPLL